MPTTPSLPADQATGWGDTLRAAIRAAFVLDGQYTKTVAGSGESAEVKAAADYVCDGTDDHVQINAALAAVGAETIGRGSNGGKVILVGRSFSIGGAIKGQTQTRLTSAYGQFGTRILAQASLAPGAAGGMIELATENTQYFQVDNLWLDGAGRSVAGLYWAVGTGQEYDSYCVAKDLYIWNVGQAGLRIRNLSGGRTRGNHFSGIRIINAGTYGVWSESPDSFYERIDSGSAGSHGFYAAHANNRYVNCKAWFSDGHGFYVVTGRDNQFSACESQDNEQHGWYIGSARNVLSACIADSNSHGGGAGNYDGFFVAGAGTVLQGQANDKNEGSRGLQQGYGVRLSGSPKGVNIQVATGAHVHGALTGAAGSGSTVNVGSHL